MYDGALDERLSLYTPSIVNRHLANLGNSGYCFRHLRRSDDEQHKSGKSENGRNPSAHRLINSSSNHVGLHDRLIANVRGKPARTNMDTPSTGSTVSNRLINQNAIQNNTNSTF